MRPMKTTARTCTPTNYLLCAGPALAGVSARSLNRMEAWELETCCSFEDRQQYGPCQPVTVRRGTATIVDGLRVFTITTEEG